MILGVFDSGLGGLTVLKEIIKNNSFDKIIYFGDTKRMPYGNKDIDTLYKYGKDDIEFLLNKGVDKIVVACGTISSNVLPTIKDKYDKEIIGIIDAACLGAKKATINNKIGVMATSATINTHIFKEKLKDFKVVEVACPKLVPLIESGEGVDDALNEYLSVFKKEEVDTLILGCTHYPLLYDKIDKYFNGKVRLINSGEVLSLKLNNGDYKKPELEFYVSSDVLGFKLKAKRFLNVEELEDTRLVDF